MGLLRYGIGSANWGWLNTLYASARNVRRSFSRNAKERPAEQSASHMPNPRTVSLPRVPGIAEAGANAAGFNCRPPATFALEIQSGRPGTRLGRRFAVAKASRASGASTSTGKAVRDEKSVPTAQLLDSPRKGLSAGVVYKLAAVTVCRASKLESPRSFCAVTPGAIRKSEEYDQPLS